MNKMFAFLPGNKFTQGWPKQKKNIKLLFRAVKNMTDK